MKVINLVGARPQFIKYFPISRAISGQGGGITDILVHTGQHYDYSMSKVFFDEFGIKEPDYHLGVGSGAHGSQTGEIIKKVEDVIVTEKPDMVLAYGDTNSTLGCAVAASKLHVPVAHVEAGLRSFNKYMPEEINRIVTDHVSTLLLCPSGTAVRHLMDEGFKNIINDGALIPGDHFPRSGAEGFDFDKNNPAVINVGDVMYDVLLYAIEVAKKKSTILDQLNIAGEDYCLLTLHRAENTDDEERFVRITGFINEVSAGRTVIFPMHPRTKKVYELVKGKFGENVRVVEPQGYFDILMLLDHCTLAITDSGGMQKEAYWLKTPCITMREETEWVETVESGWNVLYKNWSGSHSFSEREDYYGDGKTAERVVSSLIALRV